MLSDPELLTTAEQHAYRLLVRLTGGGPDELAELAGTSPQEAVAVLESLRAKGLAPPGRSSTRCRRMSRWATRCCGSNGRWRPRARWWPR